MKKILLIVGMILCVAVVGSVFAIAIDGATSSGTVTADTYIYLGFDGTSTSNIVLEAGEPTPYVIHLTVDKNAAATGTLTITFADASPKTLDDVDYDVYTDITLATPLTTNVTKNIAAKTITITGINATRDVYLGLELTATETADINACGGTMTLSFTAVAD